MQLNRLYAYEVMPQKGISAPSQPVGGKINLNASLKDTLIRLVRENKLEQQTPIAFQFDNDHEDGDEDTPVNSVRTAIQEFAYRSGSTARRHAENLALRLSQVMDARSKPFLFLMSSFEMEVESRVVLWAFPKDTGLRFATTASGAKVEVISDIFNISHALKKAALFDGSDTDASFMQGRMVDIQSGRTDLWVEGFLQCRLSVSGIYGTTMLADYVATAYKRCTTTDAQEQLFNAIVAVRTAPVRRMSNRRFANDYLAGEAKDVFLATVPAEQRGLSFDFDRPVFERKIGFRAFKMEDNVTITAPLTAIDKSVQIDERTLSYSGQISKDYLRSTSGRR